MTVVAAAGNYATDGAESGVLHAPGNDPFVITVGASDINGSVDAGDDFAAPWSAWGYTPDGFLKPDVVRARAASSTPLRRATRRCTSTIPSGWSTPATCG